MIFKVIEDEADSSGRKITSSFAKSAKSIWSAFSNESGFSMSGKLAATMTKDTEAINAYVDAIESGKTQQEAFNATMKESSPLAQQYVSGTNQLNITAEGFEAHATKFDLSLQAQNRSFGNVKTLINEYNSGMANCGLNQDEFIESVGKSNHHLGNYLKTVKTGDAKMTGYIKSLIGAKAATIGLHVATAALNAFFSMGISLAIQGVTALFDHMAHAEENASEKSREAAEAAMEVTQKLDEEADQIDELFDRYKELASAEYIDADTREEIRDIQKEINKLNLQHSCASHSENREYFPQ